MEDDAVFREATITTVTIVRTSTANAKAYSKEEGKLRWWATVERDLRKAIGRIPWDKKQDILC